MTSSMGESPFLTTEEAASYLRCSESQLAKWRAAGDGPRYLQPGGAGTRVLYRREDLDTWLEGEDSQESPAATPIN